MKDLKIGQNVLIEAKVVEHNKHDKAIAINKQGGGVERLVYVDEDSVLTPYVTTKEFIERVKELGFDVATKVLLADYDERMDSWESADVRLGIAYGSDELGYVSMQKPMCMRIYELVDDLLDEGIVMDDTVDALTRLIVNYTQTPIELRDNDYLNQ